MNRHVIIEEESHDPDLLLRWASTANNAHGLQATTVTVDLDEPSLTGVLDWDWWDDGATPRWIPLNEYIKRVRS